MKYQINYSDDYADFVKEDNPKYCLQNNAVKKVKPILRKPTESQNSTNYNRLISSLIYCMHNLILERY